VAGKTRTRRGSRLRAGWVVSIDQRKIKKKGSKLEQNLYKKGKSAEKEGGRGGGGGVLGVIRKNKKTTGGGKEKGKLPKTNDQGN